MAKARIQTRNEGRANNPRELSMLARAGLLVVAVLAVVWLLDVIGVVPAADQRLHDRWFVLGDAVGATRESTQSVLLIEGDEGTVEAWNSAPPWPKERLVQLLDKIDKPGQRPVLIAEVGHQRMFEIGAEDLDELHRRFPDTELLLLTSDAAPSPWTGGGLRGGSLPVVEGGRLAEIIGGSRGTFPAVGDRLYVQWMMPDSRLPRLPAHKISDASMEQNFHNRVVLLGVTDPKYALPIDTPVGPLSAAEVEAHALSGLANHVAPSLPAELLYLFGAVLALLLLWSFERTRGVTAAIIVVTLTAAVLVLDYQALVRGWARIGAVRPLLVIVAMTVGYWLAQATQTLYGLRLLRARVLREAGGEGATDVDNDGGFWDDLAELGAEYAQEVIGGSAASTVLERKADRWNLDVWASAKLDADSHKYIVARESLDLRRAPFRAAWLTLRASWTTDLLPTGPQYGERKTLLVPLEDDGELMGLWLIHLTEDVEVERDAVETFERLGRQMAGAIVRKRERSALREQAGTARLRDHLETIVGGMRLLHDEHRWALELLEQLPVRAVIATVWGEIEFIDPRLRLTLSRRYPGLFSPDIPDDNLRAVLARITGESLDEAHRLMRKVVNDGVEVELQSAPGLDGEGDDVVWVMSRIRSKRAIELPGFKPAVHEHILLMARSSAPAKTIKTRSGHLLRVLGGFGGK